MTSSVQKYYAKILARYSLIPTLILMLLVFGASFFYDRNQAEAALQLTLLRNKSIADQVAQNFFHSTELIAKSSFSSIALKYGDYSGYRSVIVPWISDDKSIRGLVLFDRDRKPVVSWPSEVMNEISEDFLSYPVPLQARGERILVIHKIFDNTEKLGYLLFLSDLSSLGLDKVNVTTSPVGYCSGLKFADLSVCEPAGAGNRLLFAIGIGILSIFGLLFVFFFSVSRLSQYLSQPLSALHASLDAIRMGKDVVWTGVFSDSSESVFRPIGEYVTDTISKVRALTSELEVKKEVADVFRQVAHDIRSPLSALNLATATLGDIPISSRSMISQAIERINGIANDLLFKSLDDISFLASTKECNRLEHVSLPVILEQVLPEKGPLAASKNIQVMVDVRGSTGLFINGNKVELMRVISNLINNSIESFGEGGGRIHISITECLNRIQLVISDNGRGIDPKALEMISQGEGFSSKQNGTGLGLKHARQAVERIGGALNIISSEEIGTSVTLTFSAAKVGVDHPPPSSI